MNSKKRFIFLIGFMASGKTTVGNLLSKKIGKPFYDTDAIIENKAGMSIEDIFKNKGEDNFREIEYKVLNNIVNNDLMYEGVIATGGGMPCFKNNMEIMKDSGVTVYLKVPVHDIINRIDDANKRPVFKIQMNTGVLNENIKNLLYSRESFYKNADIVVDSSSKTTPVKVVNRLINLLREI